MCIDCYHDHGLPRIVSAATLAAAEAVRLVYEHDCVGGNLHITIDDWNLDDRSLRFCSDRINNKNGNPPAQLAAERACCDVLLRLSPEERASALAIHDGFLLPDGTLSEFALGCLAGRVQH
jgi:hypothetical protein